MHPHGHFMHKYSTFIQFGKICIYPLTVVYYGQVKGTQTEPQGGSKCRQTTCDNGITLYVGRF